MKPSSTAAERVYQAIAALEGDMERLREGTTAAAVLVTYIRETPVDDPRHADLLDLQDAAKWIALAIEQLARAAYDKWDRANILAEDVAYPDKAAPPSRSEVLR